MALGAVVGSARPTESRAWSTALESSRTRWSRMMRSATERLSFMHVGGTVADLDAAIDEHRALGSGPWAVSDTLQLSTYDAEHERIVPQWTRAAYGRMAGGAAVELVEPSAESGASPQRRLLEVRPGMNHVAYWCDDVPEAVGALRGRGARLLTASVTDVDVWERALREGGEAALTPYVRACYMELATGAIVELVASALFDGPLQTMFGEEITEILPAPRATRA